MSKDRSSRNANIELLRIISMIMVTMLHALGKSDLLRAMNADLPLNGWVAWVFEVLSIGAVNVFMLITGYFLADSVFKLRRLAELVLQLFFYTFGTFVIFAALGLLNDEEKTVYGFLHYVLPVHMDVFWFITAYIVLYILIPLITAGLKDINQKQHKTLILLLLIYECFVKSLLPVRVTVDDKGYSFLWYLTVALIGSYFRFYGFRVLTDAAKGWCAYFMGCLLVYAEILGIYLVNEKTGRLDTLFEVSIEYNHLFNLILSVGLFAAFINMRQIKGKAAKVICSVSPYALGVYLFQENIIMRYRWQDWFGLRGALADVVPLFILRVILAVAVIFALGIVVDFVRSMIFRGVSSMIAGDRK